MNLTRTPWAAAPSLPIPDTTYPKKEPMSPPRIRHCRLPHSPKHPGTDAGEDPHHQMTREITVDHAHKTLLPPTKSEHDATLCALLGHEVSTSVSSPRRRRHGVVRGQPLTDPSPGTIPYICSPFPTLVTSCPSPFQFFGFPSPPPVGVSVSIHTCTCAYRPKFYFWSKTR